MSGFIYIWFDRKHKRYYIGSHWGSVDDGYICSSRWMKASYKRRPQDFKRRILKVISTTKKDLIIEEIRWLSMIKDHELRHRYYNLRNKEINHWTAEHNSLSTQKKIAKNTKKAMWQPDIRAKYLKGLKKRVNKSSDPIVREKRRQSMLQTMAKKFPVENRKVVPKFGSEEYKKNMSETITNWWAQRKRASW